MRVGVVQLSVGDDPVANLPQTLKLLQNAKDSGADLICTPEVTNMISVNRAHQASVLQTEADDKTLDAVQTFAADQSVAVLIGSLAIKIDGDTRFANRSFLISSDGEILAKYDKIHMFDVAVSDTESFQESKAYKPGETAVVASLADTKLGLSICYDLRFPYLYRDLAQAGAHILTVPSAFSPTTGRTHWHSLLRARAIETGCFVIAPAQCGTHVGRKTFGHSLVVSPWGEVLLDAQTDIGAHVVDLDLQQVNLARQRIPSLSQTQPYRIVHHG